MKPIPPRTHASTLDEDELILFDVLWRVRVPERFLDAESLSDIANTSYSHSVPDDRLRLWLQALADRNLLYRIPGKTNARFAWQKHDLLGLTESGFAAWESERLPDWSRYVMDSYSFNEGANTLRVTAVSKHIGLKFIEWCRVSGLFKITSAAPKHRIKKNVKLFFHKTFSEIHYFTVPMLLDDSKISDSAQTCEEKRVWWRGTCELWPPGMPSP